MSRSSMRWLPSVALALVGCATVLELDDFRGGEGTGGEAASMGGGGGVGAGGVGGVGQGGVAGAGTGGMASLADRGLVVRYFLHEDAETKTFADAAAVPFTLNRVESPGMTVEADNGGHRGIRWLDEELLGRASAPTSGTKLQQRLHYSTEATLEVVVRLDRVTSLSSRIVHLGVAMNSGDLTLASAAEGEITLFTEDLPRVTWPDVWVPTARHVVQVVYDSDQVTPSDRVRLWVDGELATAQINEPVVPGDPIEIGGGGELALGNRSGGERNFVGFLYYAAIYDVPLTADELAQNLARLTESDDRE